MSSGPIAEAETESEDPAGRGASQEQASGSGPGYSSTNTRKLGTPSPWRGLGFWERPEGEMLGEKLAGKSGVQNLALLSLSQPYVTVAGCREVLTCP